MTDPTASLGSTKKRTPAALLASGLAMVMLSLLAAHIGLSQNPGFGWKKLLLMLIGLPLIGSGAWLRSANRKADKLLSAVFAYGGLVAIGMGLAAHRLHLGHNPQLRWTKAVLFISGVGLIYVAATNFLHHLELERIARRALLYIGMISALVAAAVHQLGLAQDPEFSWKRLELLAFAICAMGLSAAFRYLRGVERILRALPAAWWDRLAITLLPCGLFLINRNWPFQGLGHMDPWYYFGEFIHFPHYQNLSAGYPGERLMWILPGFLLVHLLSPAYGVLALHFMFFWIGVGSLYYIVNKFTDRRTALLASCLLACHPLFIGANGWTYLDGASIGYFLLAFAFIVKAVSSRSPAFYLVLAGVWWASLVYTYILWLSLTPCCLYLYYGLSPANKQDSFVKALRHLAYFVASFSAGVILLTLCLQAIHVLLYGRGRGFFFYNNVATAFYHLTLEKSPWSSGNFEWIPRASWIVFPILAFFLSASLLLQHWRGATKLTAPEGASIAVYLHCFFLLVIMTLRPNHLLEFDYFASMLIPSAFLVLGLTVMKVPKAWPGADFYVLLALCCGVCVAPLWKPNLYRSGLIHGLALAYVVGFTALIIRLLMPKAAYSWALMICFLSIATFPLVPAYPGLAWKAEYDGIGATQRIGSAIKLIESRLPPDAYPAFWINNVNGKFTAEYRAIMCGFQSHGLSMYNYPEIDKDRTYKPGTFLILVTENQDVFESANDIMSRAGMPLVRYGQDRLATPKSAVSYWITYTKVQSNEPVLSRK